MTDISSQVAEASILPTAHITAQAANHKSNTALICHYARLVFSKTHAWNRCAKFIFRSFLQHNVSMLWYRYMDHHASLSHLPDEVAAVIADKIHRPFARCHISTRERADMLINHYDLMAKLFPADFLSKLVAGERFPIAHITGKTEDETYTITISREMLSQHQGEVAFLMINNTTNVFLARLLANVGIDADGHVFFMITGMQGPVGPHKAEIVQVTRHLNGLRPKRALVEVACAMAQWMNADLFTATAKKNHVSQTKRKWQERVVADYDDFLHEFDPETLPTGDFKMPLNLPRRNLEDIPGKKRKDAQRRYERLDNLLDEVKASLATYTGGNDEAKKG